MAKDGGGTTSSQVSQPWSDAQPYLKDVLGGAKTAYQSGGGFDYPDFGTTVPFSPQTTQAQGQIEGMAGQGNPLAGQSTAALGGILQGNGNPFWQQAVDTQAGKLTDDLNRSASGGGRLNSGYNANLIGDVVGDFRNKALSDNWNSNVSNQLNAVQAAPGAYQQQYLPAERLASVGAQNEDLATRTLNERIARFQAQQQKPWQSLSAYNALIGGAGQLGGTTVNSAMQPSNYLAPLGGALGGAQVGSMFGPLGTAAGGIGGGLLGLLGI